MCKLCELSKGTEGFILTMCDSCNVPMLALREHRKEFTIDEMVLIGIMFKSRNIRWEMKKIPEHAHCHIE
ncbi:hypothetical protein LCGC14_2160980 [marine sediment metagenome]|uniref:Uncharacterized protein n=1 Tax=marine sediment metagenome TaxID=412755 RepID=A0A0F9DSN4_9ZZZZ